jgi:YesN/AraC family two-component response regulator
MLNIIVADDERMIRELVAKILEMEGHKVRQACNGLEVMDLQEQDPADLVITDIVMPHKEGLETIIELKESYPATAIIAMSGGYRVAADAYCYLKLALKLGANYAISKPFGRKDIINAVDNVMEGDSPGMGMNTA